MLVLRCITSTLATVSETLNIFGSMRRNQSNIDFGIEITGDFDFEHELAEGTQLCLSTAYVRLVRAVVSFKG